jgi:hypothetical protein
VWHIGNVQSVDADALGFRLGRTSRSTFSQYDEGRGDFLDSEVEKAPYTFVLVDIPLEVCAVASKGELAQDALVLARRLEAVLNRSQAAVDLDASFDIGPISDPADFLEYIRSAYAIKSFWLTFTRPNPWDSDEDIQKPMERFLNAARADKGTAHVAGKSLDPGVLENLARSAAATGNDAAVKIVSAADARPVRRRLRGATVSFNVETVESDDGKLQVLMTLRMLYERVRRGS